MGLFRPKRRPMPWPSSKEERVLREAPRASDGRCRSVFLGDRCQREHGHPDQHHWAEGLDESTWVSAGATNIWLDDLVEAP